MSKNIIAFPEKGSLRKIEKPFSGKITIPKWGPKSEVRFQYKDYDFRGALEAFPEIGEGYRRNKQFVLRERFPIVHLVAGALLAKDVKNDIEAHNELMKIFQYLKQEGYRTISADQLPSYLVGYVINLINDRSSRDGMSLPELHYLHLPYFGAFIVSGWGPNAESERSVLKNNKIM